MFGIGMALVGTCGFGTLVRIGGGDLRAIVVFLVLGISALAAMRGLTGFLRVALVEPLSIPLPAGTTQALDSLLAPVLGALSRSIDGHACGRCPHRLVACRWPAHQGRRGCCSQDSAVGLAVAFGWFATGWLGSDEFDPARVASLTFVAPLGNTVLYIATMSGTHADFAIGSVAGVILGSFVAAMFARLSLGSLRRCP